MRVDLLLVLFFETKQELHWHNVLLLTSDIVFRINAQLSSVFKNMRSDCLSVDVVLKLTIYQTFIIPSWKTPITPRTFKTRGLIFLRPSETMQTTTFCHAALPQVFDLDRVVKWDIFLNNAVIVFVNK